MTNRMMTEYNHNTGETVIREMTDEEIAKHNAVIAEAEQQLIKEQEDKAKRITALAKLKALGLTADDLRALGL